jgi:hypothetical protein
VWTLYGIEKKNSVNSISGDKTKINTFLLAAVHPDSGKKN